MSSKKRGAGREEMPAVRTTIVGGRPPGCGKGIGEIPRGIEVLVKKAAVDAEFKNLLLEQRAGAAGEIGLELDPAEIVMLNAVPRDQLQAIIARTRVSERLRPAFLGRAAAVMLAALGVAVAGCDRQSPVDGMRPEPPEGHEPAMEQPAEQPDRPTVIAGVTVEMIQGEQPPVEDSDEEEPLPPAPGPVRGIRPDNPGMTKGIRPDRP